MCQLESKGHTEYRINTEPSERISRYVADMKFYSPSTGRVQMYTRYV